MRIAESYVSQVIAAADITQIIGRRVELKPAGREQVGLCPFHSDKSPSFNVNATKQVYLCRTCGATGSVLRFVMRFENLAFRDAVEALAEEVGLLPVQYDEGGSPGPDHSRLYAVLERAAAFFEAELAASDEAQAYCKERGLAPAMLRRFRVGWAPRAWDRLIKTLAGEELSLLEEAGLVLPGQNKRVHDRFRGRLMFPILDRRGRVIAFGGRIVGTGGPKYLNSPETTLFRKSNELFGMWQVRHPEGTSVQAPTMPGRILVVEGYTDVLALHEHGLGSALATLGTSLTPAHAEHLFRVVPNVCFCFDGDGAGRTAAWRALEAALPYMTEGRQASFMFLPESEDPDTLVRKEGADAFAARIDAALPLSAFLFDHLSAEVNLAIPEGRARLAERARPLIEKIPAGAFQQAMLDELADRTKVRRVTLGVGLQAPAAPALPEPAAGGIARTLVAILLGAPQLAQELTPPFEFARLEQPGVEFLAALIEVLRSHPDFTTGQLLEHFQGKAEGGAWQELARFPIPSEDQEALRQEFREGLERLVAQWEASCRKVLEARVRDGGFAALGDEEREEYRRLLRQERGDRPALRVVSNNTGPFDWVLGQKE